MKLLNTAKALLQLVAENLIPALLLVLILYPLLILLYKKWWLLQAPYNFFFNKVLFFTKREYVLYSFFSKKKGNIQNVKNRYREQGFLLMKNNYLSLFEDNGTITRENLDKIIEEQKKNIRKAKERSKNSNSLIYIGFPHVPLAFLNGSNFNNTDGTVLYEYQGEDSEVLDKGFYELKKKYNTNIEIIDTLKDYDELGKEVALKVEQSFNISNQDIKGASQVDDIIKIGLENPNRWQINSYAQIDLYQERFSDVLSSIKKRGAEKVHLFSATPVSLSYSLGRVIEHFHPEVIVYNYNNSKFDWAINLREQKLCYFYGEKSDPEF